LNQNDVTQVLSGGNYRFAIIGCFIAVVADVIIAKGVSRVNVPGFRDPPCLERTGYNVPS
jgi:hypothetical protein